MKDLLHTVLAIVCAAMVICTHRSHNAFDMTLDSATHQEEPGRGARQPQGWQRPRPRQERSSEGGG